MVTTIQISNDLKNLLMSRKLSERETFEEVIFNLIEDTLELSEQTKKDIEESEKDIKEGRVYSHEEVKRELGV